MRASAIAAAILISRAAHADIDFNGPNGVAYLHQELTVVTHVDDDRDGPRTIDQLALAGFRLHGFVGKGATIGFHAGIDLAAGATVGRHGGFAYEVGVLPLGIGVRIGRSSWLTLGTGFVATGATGALDDAVALPLDVDLELGAGRLRLIAWGRAGWIAGAPSRHDGAPSMAFADELEAMVGVRIGHHYEEYGFPTGNGPYVGVAYKELLGSRFLGLTVGYSIDMATAPKNHRRL